MGGKTSSPRSSTPTHKLSQEEHKKLTVNRQRTTSSTFNNEQKSDR